MQGTWVHSLGQEAPLEKEMTAHSSILAWKNSLDRGAWQATVHGVAELDTTEQLSTRSKKIIKIFENGKHSFPQKPLEHFMGEDRDQDSWLQLRK